MLICFCLFLRCFSIENSLEIELKLHMVFEIDFVAFEARLGTLWAPFWQPRGGLRVHLGRQVGVQGRSQRVSKSVFARKSPEDP
jgi:hypothetical protein